MTKNFTQICSQKVFYQGSNFDEICKPEREYYFSLFGVSLIEKEYTDYFIDCGEGNNQIMGGPHNDCLLSGSGNNRFLVTKLLPFQNSFGSGIKKMGNDLILNFKPYDKTTQKGDKLVICELMPGLYTSVGTILKSLTLDPDGVIIPFGNTGSVQLVGITKEQLEEHPDSFTLEMC